MKYYLEIKDGIINAIHGCSKLPEGEVGITEEKRDVLMEVIKNKPEDTLEAIYRLSAETEQYEAFERTEEEKIQWYQGKVGSGEMTLEEVPEEYRSEITVEEPQPSEYEEGYNQAILDLIEQGVL